MKIKTFKLFGVKIWETEIIESLSDKLEVNATKLKKVKQEGAVLDYSPEEEARDKQKEYDNNDTTSKGI